MVALHRARIVEWSPTAITALAATADGTVVAAARESGSLEIWNTEHWQCIKVARDQSPLVKLACLAPTVYTRIHFPQRIPGRKHAALSSLAWTQERSSGRWRLFSGGLDGLLTEWDLGALRPGPISDSFGGAVWSLAVEPSQTNEGKCIPCIAFLFRLYKSS